MFTIRLCWMLSIFLISLVECQLIKHGEGLESLDDKRIDTVSVQSDTHSAHQLAEELSSTQTYPSSNEETKQYTRQLPNDGAAVKQNDGFVHSSLNPSDHGIPENSERLTTNDAVNWVAKHGRNPRDNFPRDHDTNIYRDGGDEQLSSSAKQIPPASIPHEYQLDDVFSLPSREDPMYNRVDFVSLVVIVPPGVKHCYFYNPIANFEVDYQVVKGGHLDIGIFVRDPEGEPIAIRPPLSDSQVSISVPKYFRLLPYAICLDNRKASYAYKYVYFSVDVNINWDNPNELERQAIETLRNNALLNSQVQAASAEHAENIEKLMAQLDVIFGRLRRIEHMQQRSSNFDSTDKSLMEGNLERITTGSLFQVILMVAVAAIQVGLIRSLFDQQSYFYKIWFGSRPQNLNARC
ncbi:unnamed protein product [Heterobilharzia americana]|nr:unnamed protein product [Heterobilharzia americana]